MAKNRHFFNLTFELFVGVFGMDFACGEPPYLGGSNPTQHGCAWYAVSELSCWSSDKK